MKTPDYQATEDLEIIGDGSLLARSLPDIDTPGDLNIVSITRYKFDLDNRTLSIEDYDLVNKTQGWTIPQFLHIKSVAKSMSGQTITAMLWVGPSPIKDILDIAKPENRPYEIKGTVNGAGLVTLSVPDDIVVNSEETAVFMISYVRSHIGDGPCLHYSGSIQPEDYNAVSKNLGFVKDPQIIKRIVLDVRCMSSHFLTSVFNGNSQIAFTELHPPNIDKPVRCFEETLDYEITGQRAMYFSIFSLQIKS